MTGELAELAVSIDAGADYENEDLAVLTQRLRSVLLDLDVDGVRAATGGEVAPGSKGGPAVDFAGLIVQLATVPDVLLSVIGCVRTWLSRQQARSVKIVLDGDSIEVTGVRSEEQDRLIDLWVARHATTS